MGSIFFILPSILSIIFYLSHFHYIYKIFFKLMLQYNLDDKILGGLFSVWDFGTRICWV